MIKLLADFGSLSFNVSIAVLVFILMILSGCANPAPISASPSQDVRATISNIAPGPSDLVLTGLANAQYNLDQAVKVGALDANDPAPKCLDVLLPQGNPNAPSFTPKVTDLISAGSVAYIRLRQAQKLLGNGPTLPLDCKAVIGQIVIDSLQTAKAGAGYLGLAVGMPVLGLPIPPLQ